MRFWFNLFLIGRVWMHRSLCWCFGWCLRESWIVLDMWIIGL